MEPAKDPKLQEIVDWLRQRYSCHTVLLYGSRALGTATAASDYDVIGVTQGWRKRRLARKQRGVYWDVFIWPEAELRRLTEIQRAWHGAKLLYDRHGYGRRLIARIRGLVRRPPPRLPADEGAALRVWADKQLARIALRDSLSAYRRAEILVAMLRDYFLLRHRTFPGPRPALAWLGANDKPVAVALARCYDTPTMPRLRAAVRAIYQ